MKAGVDKVSDLLATTADDPTSLSAHALLYEEASPAISVSEQKVRALLDAAEASLGQV